MRATLAGYVAVLSGVAALAGEFINLGFDEADVSRLEMGPSGSVDRGTLPDLLPGWSLWSKANLWAPWVPYDGPIGLRFQPGFVYPVELLQDVGSPFAGKYGLFFNTQETPYGQHFAYKLSQSGVIPPWAAELRVFSDVNPRVNGSVLPSAPYEGEGGYFWGWTADVRAYAGQEVELSFIARSDRFDILGFFPIPEPAMGWLLAVGGLAVAWRLRKRSSG